MSEINNNTNAQATSAYGRQSIQSLASALRKTRGEDMQALRNGAGTNIGTAGTQQAAGAGALKTSTNGIQSDAATLQISKVGKEKAATSAVDQQKQPGSSVDLSYESLTKIQNIAERIRRVAIASSNGSKDPNAMAKEFEGLRGDMDKLLEGTKFNSSNLGSEKTKLSELDLTKGTGNGEEAWVSIDRAMDTLRSEAKQTMFQPATNPMQGMSSTTLSTTSATSTISAASAESRIRDVDMAAEMEKFKAMSLTQANQTVLAQANSSPQRVLSLLG